MNQSDLKGMILLGVLLFVGLSTPYVQTILRQIFNAIISGIILAVAILIVGGVIWYFFFRDN